MYSSAYWQRVALIREIQIQQKATYTAGELDKLYSNVINDLNSEIRKIFTTYTNGTAISREEAEQLINSAKSEEISKRLQKVLENTDDPRQRMELIKKIHAQAYGARISRLEAVKQNVYAYFKEKASIEIQKTKTLYNTVVEESYYRTVHDIAKGCNVGINFSLIPQRAVDEILSSKWHGSSFSERVWANTGKAAEQAQNIIANGLLSHKTYNQMAEELAGVQNNSQYNASRLVRTQANHFLNLGEFKAYEDLGIEEYKYLATLDEITCEECQVLDGKIFKVSEKIEGVNYPTIHPHCRCTTTLPTEYAKRWARDPISGKGYKINDMTYSEWIESLTDKQKEAFEKNVKMYHNRSSDKILYEKYRQIYGKEFPKTFDLFQDIKYNYVSKWETFKDGKQDRLNLMNFEDMSGLVGKLGNKEVRLWYKVHDENIPNLIDKAQTLEQQARQACDLRNNYKFQARELMKDKKARRYLEKNEPFKTFEDLVEHKKLKFRSYDDIYKDIIRSSTTTNKYYDEKAGLNL
ncbi:MAG: minor capsid protein [Clostridiales bacterium]|nr:minor capsid protein [Clostridiales bacterium]